MRFQRVTWRAQSVGWVMLAVLLTAALLGAFSRGPLSSTTLHSEGGAFSVEYQRLLRNGASDSMIIRVFDVPEAAALRIAFSPAFLEAFAIESTSPPPAETATSADGVEFAYPLPRTLPAGIYLSLRPQKSGLAESAITLNGRDTARLTQFTYP